MAVYTYPTDDFTSVVSFVDLVTLRQEVLESSIVDTLMWCTIHHDEVKFQFLENLSSGEQTTLDSIVAAHTGIYSEGSPVISENEFQQIYVEGSSSTTSSEFKQKVSLTTNSIPSGTYRIGWYSEISNTKKNKQTSIRIQVNDNAILAEPSLEVRDVDSWIPYSGFSYVSLSGVNTIDMDYKTEKKGVANIRYVKLEIWRVR